MKKVVSFLLVIIMCVTLSAPYAAAEGSVNYRVYGDFIFGADSSTVLGSSYGVNPSGTQLGNVNVDTITLFGWIACSEKIEKFGYRFADTTVLNGSKYETEPEVIREGASIAGANGESTRFSISVPVQIGSDITFTAVAQLKNGAVIDIWSVVYSSPPASLKNHSFDSVKLDETMLCNNGNAAAWLADNPIHYNAGEHSSLTLTGWAFLTSGVRSFAYRIDSGALVNGDFIQNRPDVKEGIDPSAEGFSITADISSLTAGTHTVDVIALAENGSQVLVCSADVSVIGENGITQHSGYSYVLTDAGFSYTAKGYSEVVDNSSFRITSGFIVTPDSYQFSGQFNRMSFSYSSTKPLRMTVNYIQNGSEIADLFFLDAGQDMEFSALIQAYLNGAAANSIRSVRFDSCTGDAADVYLKSITYQMYRVYNESVYYFENARFKVGLQLNWGGGISYIEDKTHHEDGLQNLINNYDTGRLVQQSYYGTGATEGYTPGEFNGYAWNYNPVQGGDKYQNPSRLIDIVTEGDSVYIRVQPQDWSLNGQITPSYMENRYTLLDNRIQVDNRFTDYSGFTHPVTSQEVPAFYTVSYLNRFSCYTGNKPWTGDSLTVRDDLNFWGDAAYANDCTFIVPDGDTETWCAWTSTQSQFGIGLYVPGIERFLAGRHSYDGSKSPQAGSTNYVAPLIFTALQSYQPLSYSYQITTGSVEQIRNVFFENRIIQNQDVTVSFMPEGGTCPLQSKTVTAGGVYGELPSPVRSGFIFTGWYTAASGGDRITSNTEVLSAEDHELYAHWEKIVTTDISVFSMPAKTVYFKGESLDTSGLILSVNKSDGTTVNVTDGFICSPTVLNKTGIQTITVVYDSKSASFDITVEEPCVPGDVNLDGNIDGEDAVMVRCITAGALTESMLKRRQYTAADYDLNGVTDEEDISALETEGLFGTVSTKNIDQN